MSRLDRILPKRCARCNHWFIRGGSKQITRSIRQRSIQIKDHRPRHSQPRLQQPAIHCEAAPLAALPDGRKTGATRRKGAVCRSR